MSRIVTFSLADRFIDRLADDIVAHFPPDTWPRLAIVFGGMRPRLFLQKALAERTNKAGFSPRFFSIDEFMERLAGRQGAFGRLNDLEACFHIYRLAQREAPEVLEGRSEFWRFLPWAREILGFIEQLDLEDLEESALENVAASAQIGYDVPESINTLLGHIHTLRHSFHELLLKEKTYSRGFVYLLAGRGVGGEGLEDFDHVLFCNFFYLHKTEKNVMTSLLERGRATLYFQGDRKDWSVLSELSSVFGAPIEPAEPRPSQTEILVRAGFDLHSQIGLLRKSLQENKNLANSLVVLPETSAVIPLMSEIASFAGDFNVSMGYPVARSSLYFLLELLFCCQKTRQGRSYYVKDYLKLLGHPLIKNLKFSGDAAMTRVLVHKIEEALAGTIKGPLAGSLFIEFKDLLGEQEIFDQAARLLHGMDMEVRRADLEEIFGRLHELIFGRWENISSFEDFSEALEGFLDTLLSRSPLEKFPLHLKVMERLYAMNRHLKTASFRKEPFPQEEILRVFQNGLSSELISFSGSPLKGLQILGVFETRSLGFEDVYIMDANESVLPKLQVYEPLIPRDVMTQLGLNRLEKEEEIQRYQFMRLISSARRAHIFYQERDDREKSRFLEALIWEKEKEARQMGAVPVPRAAFRIEVEPSQGRAAKRPAHIRLLENHRFSASSVNTYMKCPLRFYYQYVLGLQEKDEVAEELEPADIGTFLHSFLEEAFLPWRGRAPRVDENFRKTFLGLLERKFEAELLRKMGPDAFLAKEVIRFRMERFLEKEASRPVREILALEKAVEAQIPLAGRRCRFYARIDRIDRMEDGSVLVLDYKSGSTEELPRSPEKIKGALSSRREIKQNIRSFQLPLYAHFVQEAGERGLLNAGLYLLKDPLKDGLKLLFSENADSQARAKSVSYYLQALDVLMNELFDPRAGFAADPSEIAYCRMCPFSCLCR
ncbi:MAG: PD-(D/E)XK nuclease family protein [Candidatus Omnitrophota bacterium]